MKWKRDADYINVTTIYIHLFGCVCLKTGTGGRDSRDPTAKCGERRNFTHTGIYVFSRYFPPDPKEGGCWHKRIPSNERNDLHVLVMFARNLDFVICVGDDVMIMTRF
jgi:hypothetical protein